MKIVIACLVAAAFLVALVPLSVGIQHNAMGEFCRNGNLDTCSFDYVYAIGIWGLWFVAVFGALVAVLIVARLCFVGLKAVINKPDGR